MQKENEGAGYPAPCTIWFPRVSISAFTDSEDGRATRRTDSPSRRPAVLEGYCLGILDIPPGTTFHAVGFHNSPPFVWVVVTDKTLLDLPDGTTKALGAVVVPLIVSLSQRVGFEGHCVVGPDEIVYLAAIAGIIFLVQIMNLLVVGVAEILIVGEQKSAHCRLPPLAEFDCPPSSGLDSTTRYLTKLLPYSRQAQHREL